MDNKHIFDAIFSFAEDPQMETHLWEHLEHADEMRQSLFSEISDKVKEINRWKECLGAANDIGWDCFCQAIHDLHVLTETMELTQKYGEGLVKEYGDFMALKAAVEDLTLHIFDR